MGYETNNWRATPLPIKLLGDERLNWMKKNGIELHAISGCEMPGASFKFLAVQGLVGAMEGLGVIRPGDEWIEATSGRLGYALTRKAREYKDISVTLVMKQDVPRTKSGLPTVASARIIAPDVRKSTIQTARERGGGGWTGEGWGRDGNRMNPDQYACPYAKRFYRDWMAPSLLSQEEEIDVIVAPIGTGATICGLSEGLRSRLGESITIVGAMCADSKIGEIPGMRDEAGMAEIRHPWRKACDEILYIRRDPAFLCAPWIDWLTNIPAGPSGGAAYAAACIYADRIVRDPELREKILKHKQSKKVVKIYFVIHDEVSAYVGDRFTSEYGAENFHISTATHPRELIFGKTA